MHRFFYLLLLVLPFVGCSNGVQGGSSPQTAVNVTYAELEQATESQERVEYLGTDQSLAYFYAKEKGYFCVKTGWTSLPPLKGPWKAGEKESPIFCRIENGKPVIVRE